jgi:phospholipid/cholesterol/gamma-HCH transport system substrate-binding protein
MKSDRVAGALRPFLRTTTPIIRDELRPFARASLPTVKALRPALRDLAAATPDLTKTFKSLNDLSRLGGNDATLWFALP